MRLTHGDWKTCWIFLSIAMVFTRAQSWICAILHCSTCPNPAPFVLRLSPPCRGARNLSKKFVPRQHTPPWPSTEINQTAGQPVDILLFEIHILAGLVPAEVQTTETLGPTLSHTAIATGHRDGGLYYLRTVNSAFLANIHTKALSGLFELWHSRLGHVNPHVISILRNKGHVHVSSIFFHLQRLVNHVN